MGFFDFDYIARTVDLLPPDKRYTRMVKWLYNLITPLETDHARIFDDYKTGNDTYPVYFFSALYYKGAIVQYGEALYVGYDLLLYVVYCPCHVMGLNRFVRQQ